MPTAIPANHLTSSAKQKRRITRLESNPIRIVSSDQVDHKPAALLVIGARLPRLPRPRNRNLRNLGLLNLGLNSLNLGSPELNSLDLNLLDRGISLNRDVLNNLDSRSPHRLNPHRLVAQPPRILRHIISDQLQNHIARLTGLRSQRRQMLRNLHPLLLEQRHLLRNSSSASRLHITNKDRAIRCSRHAIPLTEN